MGANDRRIQPDEPDPDDAPALDDAFFDRADKYQGDRLVTRGCPKADETKERVTIDEAPRE